MEERTALSALSTPYGRLCVSAFSERNCKNEYTFFETLCINSAAKAIEIAKVDAAASDVLFVLASTKGNIACLGNSDIALPLSARRIARYFGNTNEPIVVSNACISGLNAIIVATRLLLADRFATAIVIGADVLSNFVVSGFSSLKAVSDKPCRPFDRDREGLNLGEAAAAMVLQHGQSGWQILIGSMHNDANHISGPSRTGEGAFRCLQDVLNVVPKSEIALVGTHGTATRYNDEMETQALRRADLLSVPVMALKGYYGHTLGAAGVLETILAMLSVDRQRLIGCRGYENVGTTSSLNISAEDRTICGTAFLKMLSGFGGCNAAIAMRKC